MTMRSRGGRRLDDLERLDLAARPAPNTRCASANASGLVTSPTWPDHVVRHEVAAVIRLQIGARNRRERLRGAAVRQPIGMEPVDEAVEEDAGDVIGVALAYPQVGDHLLFLTFDLFGRKGRVARDVRQQVHADVERILHDDDVDEAEVRSRPGAQRPADEVDLIGNLLGGFGCRPLVEERRGQVCHASLPRQVLHRSRAHQQSHADSGLLVVEDDDDLHSVRERPHLVGWELDLACRQRPRRALGRPVGNLGARGARDQEHKTQNPKPNDADLDADALAKNPGSWARLR